LTFSADGLTSRPPAEIEIACFRLAQEALTNVVRHSQAKKVEVLLERSSQALTMVIRDNGIGFDRDEVRSGASVGLSGMEERVQLVGGAFSIESTPAVGTEIRAYFPHGVATKGTEDSLV